MNIQELRIGNYLKCQDDRAHGEVLEICYIGKHGVPTINGWEIKEWSPIPLTPELLEKAGFNIIQEGRMSADIYEKKYARTLVTCSFQIHTDGLDTYWIEGNTIADIKYLHQLQNLYFALTGEELEINL